MRLEKMDCQEMYHSQRVPLSQTDVTSDTRSGIGAIAEKVIDFFATCRILEVARLGRTLRAWPVQVLAYFETGGCKPQCQ